MEGVLSRLEAVTTRLESYERGLQSKPGAPSGPATPATTVPKVAPKKPVIISTDPPKQISISDWDSLMSKEVGSLSGAGDKLPEQFQSSTKLFASAAQMMVDIVKQSRTCKKPTMQELSAIVAPMGATMQEIEAIIRGPRTPATNHHRAISECVQSFAWVTLDPMSGAPPPGSMLAEGQSSADMFITKVIMEYRQTAPEHKEWATALKAFMAKLQSMASSQFPQGLTWVGTATPTPATAAPPLPAVAPAATATSTDTSAATAAPATFADTAADTAASRTAAAGAVAESSTSLGDGAAFHDATMDTPAGSTAPSFHTAVSSQTNTLAADSEAEEPPAAGEEAPIAAEGEPVAEGDIAATGEDTAAAAAEEETHAASNGADEPDEPAAPTAAAAPKGPPPPPPPPPAGMLLEKLSAEAGGTAAAGAGGDARGELMAALNKGSGVTTGLKKVTDDMKTKNQTDRSGVVKAAPAAAQKAAAAAKGPTCKELKQNRWLVENWVACEEPVVLEETEVQRNHAVYISNCSQCVVQVKGKVNTIMLDGCSKVGLVFSSVLATVEAVNCQGCQIQCELTCPTLSIDKTDGAKVFLSEEAAAATEVVTSKCSALTLTVLPKEAESDPVEHPVPEQFVSKIVDGKLVTTPVVHT